MATSTLSKTDRIKFLQEIQNLNYQLQSSLSGVKTQTLETALKTGFSPRGVPLLELQREMVGLDPDKFGALVQLNTYNPTAFLNLLEEVNRYFYTTIGTVLEEGNLDLLNKGVSEAEVTEARPGMTSETTNATPGMENQNLPPQTPSPAPHNPFSGGGQSAPLQRQPYRYTPVRDARGGMEKDRGTGTGTAATNKSEILRAQAIQKQREGEVRAQTRAATPPPVSTQARRPSVFSEGALGARRLGAGLGTSSAASLAKGLGTQAGTFTQGVIRGTPGAVVRTFPGLAGILGFGSSNSGSGAGTSGFFSNFARGSGNPLRRPGFLGGGRPAGGGGGGNGGGAVANASKKYWIWILLLLLILAMFFGLIGGGQDTIENTVNRVTIEKKGPLEVGGLDDVITYTITVRYTASGSGDVRVTDNISPAEASYVGSEPAGQLSTVGGGITWDFPGMTSGSSKIITLKLKPLVDNHWLQNSATAEVVGGNTSGGGAIAIPGNTSPNQDNCGGEWPTFKTALGNFGDPLCTFSQDKLSALLKQLDGANAEYWFLLVGKESGYNPSNFNGNSTSGTGAYGLFQMNSQGNGSTQYDRGDVVWELQTSNAVNYNEYLKNLGLTWCYWQAAKDRWAPICFRQ